MIKQSKKISINIVSVLVILMTLLLSAITTANAWFSEMHKDKILINVSIKHINFQLFQITKNGSEDVKTEIFTNLGNEEFDSDTDATTKSQYIMLDGKISHDQPVGLHLVLENNNKGQSAMYMKFKFELFLRGIDEDELVSTTIDGFTEATATTQGFVKDENGYYYYKESSLEGASNAMFGQSASTTLMTSFTVPYSSFVDNDGNLLITNSDTIYIQLTIEASDLEEF